MQHHRVESGTKTFFTTEPTEDKEGTRTQGGRIGYYYVGKIVKDAGVSSGTPWLHPHALRHFFATMAVNGRFGSEIENLRKVQTLLGHRTLKSTERYTHLRSEDVANLAREGVNKFFRNRESEEMRTKSLPTEWVYHRNIWVCPY